MTDSIFSTIDMRSFSNLWFWLVLAVIWAQQSYFLIGVPFDLVQRARRGQAEALDDLRTLATIHARRRLHIVRVSGVGLVAFWMAVLTLLAMLGFVYGAEPAQAATLLLGPLTLAAWLDLRLCFWVIGQDPDPAILARRLMRHRFLVQFIGLMAIFVTTMWGTWYNLAIGPLG